MLSYGALKLLQLPLFTVEGAGCGSGDRAGCKAEHQLHVSEVPSGKTLNLGNRWTCARNSHSACILQYNITGSRRIFQYSVFGPMWPDPLLIRKVFIFTRRVSKHDLLTLLFLTLSTDWFWDFSHYSLSNLAQPEQKKNSFTPLCTEVVVQASHTDVSKLQLIKPIKPSAWLALTVKWYQSLDQHIMFINFQCLPPGPPCGNTVLSFCLFFPAVYS